MNTKSTSETAAFSIMVVVGAILLVAPVYILAGIALVNLWQWFVIPVFAAPELSVGQAVGISLLVGFLTTAPSTSDADGDTRKAIKTLVASLLRPIMYLFLGWIVANLIGVI